jgi:hypothetical protein
MRPHTVRTTFVGLLLITMVLLASGCASDGSYSGQASVGVYGYGYYGGYPGYYGGDVIVGAPMPGPRGRCRHAAGEGVADEAVALPMPMKRIERYGMGSARCRNRDRSTLRSGRSCVRRT